MACRIAVFGLPHHTNSKLKVRLFANGNPANRGDLILETNNNNSGYLLEELIEDISIGSKMCISIMSSGICEYSHEFSFAGADISHTPKLQKESNTSDKEVQKDWNLNFWNTWNAKTEHENGLELEKKFLLDRIISTVPIWSSYYTDSNVDFLENFHKLWIGLNAFASHITNVSGDKNKILSLVSSDLRTEFNLQLAKIKNLQSAGKWQQLQAATGLNMTSETVRDEIAAKSNILEFMAQAKAAKNLFPQLPKHLDGLVFLDREEGLGVFQDLFGKYHASMASTQGITQSSNLAEVFETPQAPKSITRLGSLVFHNPFLDNSSGSLFALRDFFGSNYENTPYMGATSANYSQLEQTDPIFFTYLEILYTFRCAYFHGDITPNQRNNELAKAAFTSLRGIFPAIL